MSLPDAVHEQIEWEIELAEARGFAAGVEYARAIMDAGIVEAVAGVTLPAKAVVRQLVRALDRDGRRPALRDRADHVGGPVDWDRSVAA